MSDGVDPKLIAELSDSQKACLRLVRAGRTSKEIARETGLSDKTIDQYMSRAVALLGVANRHAAAELLEKLESGPIKVSELRSQPLASSIPAVPSTVSPVAIGAGSDEASGTASQGDVWRQMLDLFRPPPVGGKRHALDAIQRTGAIIRIAISAIIGAAALVALVKGAIYLLR